MSWGCFRNLLYKFPGDMDDASSGSALPERSTEKTYGYC